MENVRESRLQALMCYMRHEEPEERPVIELCYDAARAYLKKAGAKDPLEGLTALPEGYTPGQYELALNSLALYYFDHRDDVGSVAPLPVGLGPVLNQLKFGGGA